MTSHKWFTGSASTINPSTANTPCRPPTGTSIEAVIERIDDPEVTILDLTGHWFGDSGICQLAAALPSSKVSDLMLGDNGITDIGAVAIADALLRTKLDLLELTSFRIKEAGWSALADAIPRSSLRIMYVITFHEDGGGHFLKPALLSVDCQIVRGRAGVLEITGFPDEFIRPRTIKQRVLVLLRAKGGASAVARLPVELIRVIGVLTTCRP
mgnify:CR=1 FL=1